MAAASYYQGSVPPTGPYELPAHVPLPAVELPHRPPPSTYSDSPPPYSPGLPQYPTPQQRQQQQQQQYPQKRDPRSYQAPSPAPYPPPQQHHLQPPSKQPYQPPPRQYSASRLPQQHAPPHPYPPPQTFRPQRLPADGDAGYRSDPEPERRRRHYHKHRDARPRSRDDRAPGGSRNAVLGATGGALIGDLIFPGLGTVLVGGLGGWYAGKKVDKAERETSREAEQRRRV